MSARFPLFTTMSTFSCRCCARQNSTTHVSGDLGQPRGVLAVPDHTARYFWERQLPIPVPTPQLDPRINGSSYFREREAKYFAQTTVLSRVEIGIDHSVWPTDNPPKMPSPEPPSLPTRLDPSTPRQWWVQELASRNLECTDETSPPESGPLASHPTSGLTPEIGARAPGTRVERR